MGGVPVTGHDSLKPGMVRTIGDDITTLGEPAMEKSN